MKCFIFIDGSNFYRAARFLINDRSRSLLKFDYSEFSKFLCKGDEVVGIRYYIGAVKRVNKKSEILYADQQRAIAFLQKHNIKVVLGTIIRHPDKTFHEKGVDIKLAVEMIRFARLNEYDKAILISSDTDFVPAVEEVQSFNKKVKYVAFPKNQSFGLTKVSDETILLRKEDLDNFFPDRKSRV